MGIHATISDGVRLMPARRSGEQQQQQQVLPREPEGTTWRQRIDAVTARFVRSRPQMFEPDAGRVLDALDLFERRLSAFVRASELDADALGGLRSYAVRATMRDRLRRSSIRPI